MGWAWLLFKIHQSNPDARDAWQLAIFPSIQYKVGVLEKKNAWIPPSYPEILLRQFTLIKRNHICTNLLFGGCHVAGSASKVRGQDDTVASTQESLLHF